MFSLELIRTVLLLCQTEYTHSSSIRECFKEYLVCARDESKNVDSGRLLQCYLNKSKD